MATLATHTVSGCKGYDRQSFLSDPASRTAADQPSRQMVQFIGGSQDGRAQVVPFVDGGACVWIEMPPQVVLARSSSQIRSFEPLVKLEQYIQRAISTDSRKFAICADLEFFCLSEEIPLRKDQLSVDAVRNLRESIRVRVADLGGRILPAALGQEDVLVELLSAVPCSIPARPLRFLRGQCWFVVPAQE